MPKLGDIKKAKEIGYKNNAGRYIWAACVDCGKERWVQLHKGKSRYIKCPNCSKKGKNNPSFGKFGEDNSCWKGGKYKDSCGYILIKIKPTNPFSKMSDGRNYVLEHRLVMAQNLNRCLESWEVVHHINGIRNDNRIENLKLHEISDHQAITILETKNKKLEKKIKELKEVIKTFGGKL